MKIDLRSDTITRPSSEMLKAMLSAKVGDDVFKEDSTVNLLEEKIADMFGKERALFFPSGTMANQVAIKLHTQPGEQIIADKYAHIYNFEGGGASLFSGISFKLIDGIRGMITASQVKESINNPFDLYHSPLTSLVCLENTTNKGGGACYDFNEINKIKEICDLNNLGYHLDGARLWNAMVAKGENAKQYGEVFDSISVCLSKGLGAPLGSVLIGDNEIIDKAIRLRKAFGGGMRQIGYMAAAGLYAIENNIDRLKEDHQRAKEIGEVLNKLSFVKQVEPIDTNIIIFTIDRNEEEFISKMASKNIHFVGMGQGKLRFVTHLDYTQEMHIYFLELLIKLS